MTRSPLPRLGLAAALSLLFLIPLRADAPPADAPATAPASRPRRLMPPPPGYSTLSVSGVTIYCAPADEGWVKEALKDLKPATRPTTMPADLLKTVREKRDTLVQSLARDTGLPDTAPVGASFDSTIIAPLDNQDRNEPVFFYLIITGDNLKAAVADGWGAGQFTYNRRSKQIDFTDQTNLPPEGKPDECVYPIVFNPADDVKKRSEEIPKAVQLLESRRWETLKAHAERRLLQSLFLWVHANVVEPLKLRRDQQWFGMGVEAYFSSIYFSDIMQVDRIKLLENMIKPTQNVVSLASIDLVHPFDSDVLRPDAVLAYEMAMQCRSTLAVFAWAEPPHKQDVAKPAYVSGKGAPDILAVLTRIRAQPAADGPALVKVILDATGADVGPLVGPQGPNH